MAPLSQPPLSQRRWRAARPQGAGQPPLLHLTPPPAAAGRHARSTACAAWQPAGTATVPRAGQQMPGLPGRPCRPHPPRAVRWALQQLGAPAAAGLDRRSTVSSGPGGTTAWCGCVELKTPLHCARHQALLAMPSKPSAPSQQVSSPAAAPPLPRRGPAPPKAPAAASSMSAAPPPPRLQSRTTALHPNTPCCHSWRRPAEQC